MLITVLLVIFYLFTPALLIFLSQKSNFLNKIGTIAMAYVVGLVAGNIGIFPKASTYFLSRLTLEGKASLPKQEMMALFDSGKIAESDITLNQIKSIQDLLMTASVLIAIPLLVFSLDLKKWLKLAKGALFSLMLALISLITVILIGYFLFRSQIPEIWKVSGMLIGVYTGGTPNLAAISTALEVSPNTFILTNTYDMVIGAFAFIFLLTMAQRLFNKFLPTFLDNHKHINLDEMEPDDDGIDNFNGMSKKKNLAGIFISFGLSVAIAAIGGGLSMIVPKSAQMVTIILTITTLGLAASTIKFVNRIEKSFQAGMYLILIFSLVVASQGNLRGMFQIEYLYLFLFVALAVFGSIVIHVGLSYIFKVDSDSTIITITALTYSPPFVPAVAGALKNKHVIISGLTVGIIGYAIGNYLGVFIAYILKGL